MEAEQKKFILDKLHSESQNIRQVLDVVNTVLGFLASAGGQSDMPLVKYICDVLKTECPFSQVCYEIEFHQLIHLEVQLLPCPLKLLIIPTLIIVASNMFPSGSRTL